MKKIAMVAMIAVMTVFVAAYSYAAETEIYGKVGYVDWKEHSEPRYPAPREAGAIYSVGVNVLGHPTEHIFTVFNLEGFEGSLDYNGQRFSDFTTVETKTNRLGVIAEIAVGYRTNVGNFYLSPFVSLGFSAWGRSASGEVWNTGYGKVGAEIGEGKYFVKAGLIIPIYTENDCILENVGWLNQGRETKYKVRPRGIPTYFTEVGTRYGRLIFSASYELKKWNASKKVEVGGKFLFFQPDTTQEITSFKIGIFF